MSIDIHKSIEDEDFEFAWAFINSPVSISKLKKEERVAFTEAIAVKKNPSLGTELADVRKVNELVKAMKVIAINFLNNGNRCGDGPI